MPQKKKPDQPKTEKLDEPRAYDRVLVSITRYGQELLDESLEEFKDAWATKHDGEVPPRTALSLSHMIRHGIGLAAFDAKTQVKIKESKTTEVEILRKAAARAEAYLKENEIKRARIIDDNDEDMMRRVDAGSLLTAMLRGLGDELGVEVPDLTDWIQLQPTDGTKKSNRETIEIAEQRVLARLAQREISGKKKAVRVLFDEMRDAEQAFTAWRFRNLRPNDNLSKTTQKLAKSDPAKYLDHVIGLYTAMLTERGQSVSTEQEELLRFTMGTVLDRAIEGRTQSERAEAIAHRTDVVTDWVLARIGG